MPSWYSPVSNVISGRRSISSPTNLDSFGIPKLYANSNLSFKPAPWEMGISAGWDDPNKITQWDKGTGNGFTGSGTETMFDRDTGTDNIRMNVRAEPSTWSSLLTNLDRGFLASRLDPDGVARGGYMARPSDWRDVEITGCIFLWPNGSNDNGGWFARGGSHGANACEGCKYDVESWYLDNQTPQGEVNKETAHGGDGENAKTGGSGNPTITDFTDVGNYMGEWVYWKKIFRNLPQGSGGAPAFYPAPFNTVPLFPVNLQFWIIRTGLTNGSVLPPVNLTTPGNWTKHFEVTDDLSPTWGNNGGCGGPDGAVLSWGGPVVTLRVDGTGSPDNFSYGHITIGRHSAREINPALQVNTL